jgi:cell division transport system permease protein
MKRYFGLHLQNLVGSLGRLARQPIAALLTGLVISIALALPAGLRVLVNNADVLSASWESVADFTVYLEHDTSEARAAALADEIEARDDVTRVELITRDDALEEFRVASGFGDALDALEENPLPHTLVVRPSNEDLTNVEALAAFLDGLEETALVQLDTEWVERLRAMLELGGRFVDIASVLLGLAVLVVIGNTIRLEINNRREEIVVMKLVGGSDGFIRRPFLYTGLWYGLIGAFGAAVLIGVTLLLLGRPVAELAALYGSRFSLSGLSLEQLGLLLGSGAGLGLIGAAFATARHLRSIEPT